ncbi:MAG TPA: hypothetical protein VMZ04_03000 [Anaerolineae bacterium]|nr:hypothetical protein [Anaerolineae bacterium]
MKRLSMFLLWVFVMCTVISLTSADPLLIPYTYFEGFESGSVGSWSSYPPAQDTAYDPTIWIKPLFYENASQRALYREIQPNYEIDYIFGVRKKLDMYVDHSSTLTFKCYIKSNRNIDGVKVRFGFADYSMVEKTIPYNNPLS